jgi:hypothetical protein
VPRLTMTAAAATTYRTCDFIQRITWVPLFL